MWIVAESDMRTVQKQPPTGKGTPPKTGRGDAPATKPQGKGQSKGGVPPPKALQGKVRTVSKTKDGQTLCAAWQAGQCPEPCQEKKLHACSGMVND